MTKARARRHASPATPAAAATGIAAPRRHAPPASRVWAAALVAVFALVAIFAARRLADADLGYHLEGGEWILQHRGFPTTDTFTYTRTAAAYVDLHWLFQLLVYATYAAAGYVGLSGLAILLILIVFALTFARLERAGAPRWMSAWLLAAAALGCELRFQMRPELLTWIYLSAMLWVFERRAQGGGSTPLALLPIIQLIWTNSEGLFGIGWGVIGIYLLSDLVHARKIDWTLWAASGLAVLACLVNPYFVRGALLPFTYLATLGASSPFKQTIAEFQSPWTMGGRFTTPAVTLAVYKTYSVFLAIALAATIRRRRVHEVLLAAAFFSVSATALRNIPLFMLTTLPAAAASWRDLPWGWLKRVEARVVAAPWLLVTVIAVFALRAVTSAHYIDEGRLDRFGAGLDPDVQPVGAADFLVRNRLTGRILNHMNVGGWLDWQRAGQVFIDGRTEVMGDDLYAESLASLRKGGLARLVAAYRPDILVFNPVTAREWVVDLRDMPEWRPVFLDEGACVFLRAGYAPDIPPLEPARVLAERNISWGPGDDPLSLLRADGPSWWSRYGRSLYRPAIHPNGLQAMAIFFQDYGQPQASERLFLECIRRSGGAYYDFYFNAGVMYYAFDQPDKLRAAMERVLKDDPENPTAARLLSAAATAGPLARPVR